MMAELNKSNGAVAARVQVGRKFAQDFVRVLILLVDQRRKVALGIKQEAPSSVRYCRAIAADIRRDQFMSVSYALR
jgi:hypothetical protein